MYFNRVFMRLFFRYIHKTLYFIDFGCTRSWFSYLIEAVPKNLIYIVVVTIKNYW